mmetsp:Transcript_15470/g.42695  ORF Transcript_15470/g.42695 Transcript_15470/m.42695 type:complete len:249 (-) Transcript_15470:195-941(-)
MAVNVRVTVVAASMAIGRADASLVFWGREGCEGGRQAATVEGTYTQDRGQRHVGIGALQEPRRGVHGREARECPLALQLRCQVRLVEDQHVGTCHLLRCLGLQSQAASVTRLLLPGAQGREGVASVNERDDTVEVDAGAQALVDPEDLADGLWICSARSLYNNVIKALPLLQQAIKHADESVLRRTAEATVGQLIDVLERLSTGVSDERGFDAHLRGEFILDDRDAVAVRLLQDVLQERRLASPQHTG